VISYGTQVPHSGEGGLLINGEPLDGVYLLYLTVVSRTEIDTGCVISWVWRDRVESDFLHKTLR